MANMQLIAILAFAAFGSVTALNMLSPPGEKVLMSQIDNYTEVETKRSDEAMYDAMYLRVENKKMRHFESFAKGGGGMEPHMSNAERRLFYELLDKATSYQEFGAGGSTVVALKRENIKHIHTIEGARDWVRILRRRQDVSSAITEGRMTLVYADIGPTGAWGNPTRRFGKYPGKATWPEYSGKAAERADGVRFDLIFVDGRFRVACLLKALKRVPDSERNVTVFAMHDYTNRKQYHVVERFVRPMNTVNTLNVFQAKADINQTALDEAIAVYDYNYK